MVKGFETLAEDKLLRISDGLDELVNILGVKEIAPRLILSPEVNLSPKNKKKTVLRLCYVLQSDLPIADVFASPPQNENQPVGKTTEIPKSSMMSKVWLVSIDRNGLC